MTRYSLIGLLFFLFFQNSAAQDLTIARSGNSVFLEKSRGQNFRLGPSAKRTLIEGLEKAKEWQKLNQSHRKSFTKEIRRFKVITKSSYEFYGYTDLVSQNMFLTFTGYSDGSFKCLLKIEDLGGGYIGNYWTMTTIQQVQRFTNLLNGKSNSEIDQIFKN